MGAIHGTRGEWIQMRLGVFGVLAVTKLLQASSLWMQSWPYYSITSGMGSPSQNSESSCQCDGVSSREGGIPGTGRLTAHNSDLEELGLPETDFSRHFPVACKSGTSRRVLPVGLREDWRSNVTSGEMLWPWVHPTCPQGQDLKEIRQWTHGNI